MKRFLLWALFASAAPVFANPPVSDGEVVRVVEKRNELLVRHGPMPHLEMGPMTMAFPVKDPALLRGLKPGDKIKFIAEKIGDEAVITKIEVVK
jgi:Cu/Ag efflux protein CusF